MYIWSVSLSLTHTHALSVTHTNRAYHPKTSTQSRLFAKRSPLSAQVRRECLANTSATGLRPFILCNQPPSGGKRFWSHGDKNSPIRLLFSAEKAFLFVSILFSIKLNTLRFSECVEERVRTKRDRQSEVFKGENGGRNRM